MMGSKVKDVMTSQVVSAQPSTPFKELVRLLAERHVSAVPVVDEERNVLGVVSEADLILKQEQPADAFQRFLLAGRRQRLERLKARGGTAAELMSWPVVTVGPEADVAEAARLLRKHLVRRMPVIDSAGRLVGIVSQSDVLKVFLRPDEEIRREIVDQVLRGGLVPGPDRIQVSVCDGVVLLEGACQRRAFVPVLVRAVAGVEGVVRVENRLGFDVDDESSLPYTFGRPLP
ncbi:MAG TPA: CBS domain-containing protein [Actinomycetes bacterium]|nr:CBS domain-containing protein [Actinomycetes bacterium]